MQGTAEEAAGRGGAPEEAAGRGAPEEVVWGTEKVVAGKDVVVMGEVTLGAFGGRSS